MDITKAVRALAKKADVKGLAEALGELLKAAPAKPQPIPARDPFRAPPPRPASDWKPATRTRRSSRRVPRFQRYSLTGKRNDARRGTFRHYMLEVIMAHSSVSDAMLAHGKCDNANYAKNKLDFGWASANGYITLD